MLLLFLQGPSPRQGPGGYVRRDFHGGVDRESADRLDFAIHLSVEGRGGFFDRRLDFIGVDFV